jgi:hypothetical protein
VIAKYHLGDLASIAGLMVSVIGFFVTIAQVWRSVRASELAQKAAESAKSSILAFETAVDIGSAIERLEELKAAHRQDEWLPKRYAELRRKLIDVRTVGKLNELQGEKIQAAVVDLRDMEDAAERFHRTGTSKPNTKLNGRIAHHIDELTVVLAQLKVERSGG